MHLNPTQQVSRAQCSEAVVVTEATGLLKQESTESFDLAWYNITVKYKKDIADSKTYIKNLIPWRKSINDYTCVLNNVTGKAEGGQLIALMGASGGGKTTLLAAIGNRLKGQISGEVYLNGHLVTRSLMMKVSGFVPQNNIAFNTLTVNEHLLFMARMRMDSKISASSRKTWINSLVSELGLSTCADTVLSKISGGELKRLMLAIELLTDPPILLCDEPTTGLDSYNAQIMIQKLKSLAARGKIVICSVHQPSSEVFRFFDHLILLAEGRVAFQGTLSEAAEFFKRLGYMCPDSFNPADFYIKQLSVITDYEEECLKNIRKICTAFSQSDFSKALEKKPDTAPAEFPMELCNYTKISHCNWLSQFYWLIWRSMKDSRRSYFGHALQIIMFLTTTTVVATFYQGVSPETQEGMQDFRGLLYLLSSEMFFYSAYSVLYTFPYEIPIFLRESNLYSSSAYYISKVIAAMPRTVIETAVFFGFIFILADFPVGGLVGYFMLLGPLLLISIGALAYGCMMSALFESYDLIATLTVAIDLLSMLMAGIFNNLRALPKRIAWLKYLSQFYYCNELLASLFWKHVDHISCPNNPDLPCLHNGEEVLDQYGFNPHNTMTDIIVLFAFFVLLSMIGFIQIWRRSRKYSIY
ncbi:protein scarlet-like [Schistocerca nitens]|uniref:protein scarlet-like n=1 Tax=Schistocerca nitens TaxID=7011 RepID=UPI0021173C95|nr:protein scarlet-like [Schistocerca nitens]